MPLLSIIIPCYNEAKRLPVADIQAFLQTREDVAILFINDGSSDNTQQILDQIKTAFPARVDVIQFAENEGKAVAIRTGLLKSVEKYPDSYHGYIDADYAVSFSEFMRLYEVLLKENKQFILGSRIKKLGSTIVRNEWRHFYSRIIYTIIGFIIKINVYDTQCSAKIFHSRLLPYITEQPFKTKWLFDVEIICRINQKNGSLQDIGIEEPLLQWEERKGSKLRWFHFFHILREIFILNKYYRAK